MNANEDPLDQAFGLLKARSQGRAPTNPDLEELVMREFGNANRSKVTRLTKVAAAVVLCVVATGAAAATGGIDAIMDWVNVTGFFELPDGSSGYVENGKVISGEMNFEGTMHRVEDGKMLDEDGNVLGSVQMQTTRSCSEGSCTEE